MIGTRVARRYAEALLDAASEAGVLERVESDLEFAVGLLAEPEVSAFVLDPTVDRATKTRFFVERVALHVSPLFANFLRLLVDRRREEVLDRFDEVFRRTRERREGIRRGRAETARPLSEEDRRSLEAALEKAFGGPVRLEVQVRPELVGGLRLEVEGRFVDATVPGRLGALRERWLAVPLGGR